MIKNYTLQYTYGKGQRYGYFPLEEGATFSSCCGSRFYSQPPDQEDPYSHMGIMLVPGLLDKTTAKEHEDIVHVQTKNGDISFNLIYYNKELANDLNVDKDEYFDDED